MFAFEMEPQISFKHPLLAKKKIYFAMTYLKKSEDWELEERIINGLIKNERTILLPQSKFEIYMDTSLDFLEVRNTHPFSTIEKALKQIDERTEDLAKRLYEILKIPFAFILPGSSTFVKDRKRFLLSKHLNIDYDCEFGEKLLLNINNLVSINFSYYICIKGNANKRIHIKLPYRFRDYSLQSLENYLQSIARKYFLRNIEEKYNMPKHEIIGYINDWGEWKWINKYY